jgi:hypothetical protein
MLFSAIILDTVVPYHSVLSVMGRALYGFYFPLKYFMCTPQHFGMPQRTPKSDDACESPDRIVAVSNEAICRTDPPSNLGMRL